LLQAVRILGAYLAHRDRNPWLKYAYTSPHEDRI
jgi:hypothetical protein